MEVLINQPVGLGDIIFCQPIADYFIKAGYEVHWPVQDIYLDQVRKHMPKTNLHWISTDDVEMPMWDLFQRDVPNIELRGDNIYMPLTWSFAHHPNCSVMMSKYYYAKVPLTDWRKNWHVKRDYDREHTLIDTYGFNRLRHIDFPDDYTLINYSYGTYPGYKKHQFDWLSEWSRSTIPYAKEMKIEEDMANGFTLFDWIGAIEKATHIHTVNTAISYFVDKFATTDQIHMYERRTGGPPNYYFNTSHVARNPDWIFHVS